MATGLKNETPFASGTSQMITCALGTGVRSALRTRPSMLPVTACESNGDAARITAAPARRHRAIEHGIGLIDASGWGDALILTASTAIFSTKCQPGVRGKLYFRSTGSFT